MGDTVERITGKIKIFEENFKEMKKNGDLFGAFTNLLLYCNNKHALSSQDENEITELKKAFAELSDLQSQLKSKISYNEDGDDEVNERVKQHILDPCDKKNCLLFNDVIGLHDQKEQILESFAYPIIYPKLYPKGTKGMLFYGPPGTGKTYIMKATVNQLQVMDENLRILYYSPTGAELKGKYVGETEKNIKAYFDVASENAKACEKKNNGKKYISIIFIDEVEAIAGDRAAGDSLMTNSVNTLLQMMDGVNSHENVAVVAATNYPWNLDSAILRRLQKRIHIKLPENDEVRQLMHFELDRYLSFKNYIDEFDKDPECKDENRPENKCQDKVCELKDDSTEYYDPKWIKGENRIVDYLDQSNITSLIDKNAAICSGDEIRPSSLNSADSQNLKSKYSNSDVSNFMANVFTNAATRVKEGSYTLVRIKDELVYLFNGVKPIDPRGGSVDEIIEKNQNYEIKYIEKLIKLLSLDDGNEEIAYYNDWYQKLQSSGSVDVKTIDELKGLLGRDEELPYIEVPPPPGSKLRDTYKDNGKPYTFKDHLKNGKDDNDWEKTFSSLKENPINSITITLGDTVVNYIKFNDSTEINVSELVGTLNSLLENKAIQEVIAKGETKSDSWYRLSMLGGLTEKEKLSFKLLERFNSKSYLVKNGEKIEISDNGATLIATELKRKMVKVFKGIGFVYINEDNTKFVYTFKTEVKNNGTLIEGLSFNKCYGEISVTEALKFVFEDVYNIEKNLSYLSGTNRSTSDLESSTAGGGKKTKKVLKMSNKKTKLKGGKLVKPLTPIKDYKTNHMMVGATDLEKVLYFSEVIYFDNERSQTPEPPGRTETETAQSETETAQPKKEPNKFTYTKTKDAFTDQIVARLLAQIIVSPSNKNLEITGNLYYLKKENSNALVEYFKKYYKKVEANYLYRFGYGAIFGSANIVLGGVSKLTKNNYKLYGSVPSYEEQATIDTNLGNSIKEGTKIITEEVTKPTNQDIDKELIKIHREILRNFDFEQEDFNKAFDNIPSSINPIEVERLNFYDRTNKNPCKDEEFIKEHGECGKR